jgi:hypothetical protein
LYKALQKGATFVLKIYEELGESENLDLRNLYVEFLNKVVTKFEYHGKFDDKTCIYYNEILMFLKKVTISFTYEEILKNFLSSIQKQAMQVQFKRLCNEKLSKRARNLMLSKISSFEDLVPYFDCEISNHSKLSKEFNGKKSLIEIQGLIQEFKNEFLRISSVEDEQLKDDILQHEFSFLSKYHREFVLSYQDKYSHFPYFFMLHSYLYSSLNDKDLIYSMRIGLVDGKIRTLKQIADIFGLTRERVRQILLKYINFHECNFLHQNIIVNYKELFNEPYITVKSKSYLDISKSEELNFNFRTFANLFILIDNSNYKIIEINGHSILVSNYLLSIFDIKLTIAVLNKLLASNHSEDTLIPLTTLIKFKGNKIYNEDIINLLTAIINEFYHLEITPEGCIFISQNHIDVRKELFCILQKHGRPMHLKQLFEAFKKKYPQKNFNKPNQLKPYLSNHPHIKHMGKQSMYTLDSWNNVFSGSIRDLIIQEMTKSSRPMTLTNITHKVIKYFPHTNAKSILASMLNDSLHRFKHLDGGCFGLASKSYVDTPHQLSLDFS